MHEKIKVPTSVYSHGIQMTPSMVNKVKSKETTIVTKITKAYVKRNKASTIQPNNQLILKRTLNNWLPRKISILYSCSITFMCGK